MDQAETGRARFVPVDDDAALDALIERSKQQPVLLFNYDPYCGVNAAARREVIGLDAEIAVVDVDEHHDLGQLVARRTGVRHESPQLILLRDGKAVWAASHFNITAGAVRAALGQPAG
jgi:bacillithiol system protein YtxJ